MADAQFFLAAVVVDNSAQTLINGVSDAVSKGAKSILLAISSPGGNIYWGVTLYNFLRGLGIDITTHNLGQVDSVAGVVYCAGQQRKCVSQGRFLIHGVSQTFHGTDVTLPEKQLQEQVSSLAHQRDTIAAILAERSGRELSAVKKDMLDGSVFSAEEAKQQGYVHEITDEVFDPTQEIVRIL